MKFKGMEKVGDLLLVNLLFVVCSLPVVTIGASATAMTTHRRSRRETPEFWCLRCLCGRWRPQPSMPCLWRWRCSCQVFLHWQLYCGCFACFLRVLTESCACCLPCSRSWKSPGKHRIRAELYVFK